MEGGGGYEVIIRGGMDGAARGPHHVKGPWRASGGVVESDGHNLTIPGSLAAQLIPDTA